jgi:tetratricopeptide (TPR) repeat protein
VATVGVVSASVTDASETALALTDPELDLLQELLADDPTDDVFVQVGEELNRRSQFAEAVEVLRAGLDAHADDADGWRALARAALETHHYDEALSAWKRAGDAHQADPDFARLRILALERSGRIDDARSAVAEFEARFEGHDVVVEAAKERMEAPPAAATLSAADPFLTVGLAERYVALGREDRALRVYRRILFHHPDDVSIQSRLEQLKAEDSRLDDYTDLSEELADPNLVPPDLTMPMPAITSASVKPAPSRASVPQAGSVPNRAGPAPTVDEIEDAPSYTAPAGPSDEDVPTQIDAPVLPPTPAPTVKRKPAALEQFIESSKEAERRVAQQSEDDDDELEELPGLNQVGLSSPRKRRKRRSLLKR